MTGNRSWGEWKKWTGVALIALLVVDVALGVFLWRASQAGPEKMAAERDRLSLLSKQLKADVDRCEKIRSSMATAGKDADSFYHQTFLDRASGYSSIETDLNAIATSAGLRASGVTFKEKEIKDRGVTEISMATSVEGDYSSIIKFINGLERSKNFYLLNNLHLASATQGGIKLDLQLRTYFRS
jgi:Tfp pilus assembly protein PilO